MKNIIKYTKRIFMCFTAVLTIGCLAFALMFGIAGIGAISQVSLLELITLFSFCYLFSLAGSGFLTVTGQLYESARS